MRKAGITVKFNIVSHLILVLVFILAAQTILSEESITDEEDVVSAEAILLAENPSHSGESPDNYDPAITQELSRSEETWGIEDYDDDPFIYYAPEIIKEVPFYKIRSLNGIFPDITQSEKNKVMSGSGLRNSFERGKSPVLFPDPNSMIDLLSGVMKKNPTHIIEVLAVIPYDEKELDILDIYNALGRIEKLKLQTFPGNSIPVFGDITRIDNAQRRMAVSDPLPSDTLPFSETMYLRITDRIIGNIFLRGDISLSMYGITYNFTNFTDINFIIFRVMRTEMVSVIIYLEPVEEGILIYGVSGLQLPAFFLNIINLTPNIDSRVTALLKWITEGLRLEDKITAEQEEVSP